MPIQGRCNCGAISITINNDDVFKNNTFCHCLSCRKQSGGAGTIVVPLEDEDIVMKGEPKVWVDDDTTTGFPMGRWYSGGCGWYVTLSLKCGMTESSPSSSPVMSTPGSLPGKK